MNLQTETSSIRSVDRRSLLKAWGELDVGFNEGPVDYLWLFYTAFYTAKGIPRAKTFYVSKLSIWKEPALRMSFYHEYLVATIRSEGRSDKREYYLLFERTAGQLNTEKKTEEDLGEKTGEGDDDQRNEGDVEDFTFVPDRHMEDKVFGAGPQHWSNQSDDEGGPRSASTHGSSSPKSDGISTMLGMLSAAKDLASNASESSSKDMILADDRYQLIDRPRRRPDDILVAWIVLGRPNGPNPDPSEKPNSPTDGSAKEDPTSEFVPNSPHFQPNTSLDSLHAVPSGTSAISDYASRTSSGTAIRKVSSSPPSIATAYPDTPDWETRRRTQSNVSHMPHSSSAMEDIQLMGARGNNSATVNPDADVESPQDDQAAEELTPFTSTPSVNDIPAPTFLDQLPFAACDIEETPVTPGPLSEYLNFRSLSTETFQFSGHPLLRLNTNLSDVSNASNVTNLSKVSRSSRFRLRRKNSFSTIHYDALPPLPPRKHIYLYELVALACRLHKCTSLYRIFTRNCYWFAGMIFHVIRVFTGIDASITGEEEVIDRMEPSTEVMLWVNSGRLGTFLRSVRIVKAPRLFTVYALIRKWHGAISRFEDQVNVNFADNTPQQMRIIQLAMDAEIRKRKAAEVEAERRAQEAREAEAGVDRKVQEIVGAELRKVQEAAEAELKKFQEAAEAELKKRQEAEAEERRKREEAEAEERKKREEAERRFEELQQEMERKMKEYEIALRRARGPALSST